MGIEIKWRSKPGTLTDDNRDYCGVGLSDDAALCVVLDGSTSCPTSGEFSREIARSLIDWFTSAGKVTVEAITDSLRAIHGELSVDFRRDSTSLVIAHIDNERTVQLLHVGDCLAGIYDGGAAVEWSVKPHTLTNALDDLPVADIAKSRLRNRLTRSFRSRGFMAPTMTELTLRDDQALVLATDGFWAALGAEAQARFLFDDDLPRTGGQLQDDCSALLLRRSRNGDIEVNREASANLYIARAEAS